MIGLFIGSFNPPTLAHLEICLNLAKNLKKIVLIPVNSPDKELIDLDERINMLSIYVKKYPFLIVDNIMKKYSYLNYRIIDILKNKYQNITIIMGSDLLDQLSSFDNYEYLLNNYSFIIVERENFKAKDIINKKYWRYKNHFTIINYHSNISSSLARKLLKNGGRIENVLDLDVLDYIQKHDLY